MNHGLRNGGGVGDILRKPSKDVSNPALPLGPSQAAAGLPPSHTQPVSVTLSRVIGSHPSPLGLTVDATRDTLATGLGSGAWEGVNQALVSGFLRPEGGKGGAGH